MIKLRIKKFLEEKNIKDGSKITLNEVATETGISRATLNRMVNDPNIETNANNINRLCFYFDCSPCDLIAYERGLNEDDQKKYVERQQEKEQQAADDKEEK